jgi:hypothetical protein
MADYFVDSTTGNDLDDGSTMDLAWATLEQAVSAGSLSAGDTVWVRRVHSETPAATINAAYDGTPSAPISIIGWPRNTAAITGATWTQGSTTVDNVAGLSMDREKHVGRWISSPSGPDYLITRIVDSDTFIIDRPYANATVAGANGAATIQADEDYALAQAIDDSGWTITKSDYNSDADDLPLMDWTGVAGYLYITGDFFHVLKNYYFIGGDSYCFRTNNAKGFAAHGILMVSNTQIGCYLQTTGCYFDRIICEGSGSGSAEQGIVMADCTLRLSNSAIYGMGDAGMQLSYGLSYLENVNIGVEVGNTDSDLILGIGGHITGRDVKFGGNSDEFARDYALILTNASVDIENYNKVLGSHVKWNSHGTLLRVDVVGGSGDPEKRPGGADSVVEVTYDQANVTYALTNPIPQWTSIVFTHEFEVNNESKNYRYYVQCPGSVPADELWIEAEYVSEYTGQSRYVHSKVQSDEAISARTGADDWSNYIEVTGIQPDTPGLSKVRIRCYCAYYHASNKIYIDPNPEIT